MASVSKLPAELLIIVLELLSNSEELEGGQNALAILNLALTSGALFRFVTSWASGRVKQDLNTLRYGLESKYAMASERLEPSALSILCKQVAGLCSTCNNKQVRREFFTNLQVCHACDPFYFPKVSSRKLLREYYITPSAVQTFSRRLVPSWSLRLKVPDSSGIAQRCGPVYRWSDIRDMITRGELSPKRALIFNNSEPDVKEYNCEEFGAFAPPDCRSSSPEIWPNAILWAYSSARWTPGKTSAVWNTFRPSTSDQIFYDEFRSRFESGWRHLQNDSEGLNHYISVARHWVDSGLWNSRPWRACNFPLQPRGFETAQNISESEQKRCIETLAAYRNHSAKLRAVIKAFPSILSSPQSWVCCVLEDESLSVQAAVVVAKEAYRTWTERKAQDETFYLRTHNLSYEIELIKGKDVPTVPRNEGYLLDEIKIEGGLPRIVHRI